MTEPMSRFAISVCASQASAVDDLAFNGDVERAVGMSSVKMQAVVLGGVSKLKTIH